MYAQSHVKYHIISTLLAKQCNNSSSNLCPFIEKGRNQKKADKKNLLHAGSDL